MRPHIDPAERRLVGAAEDADAGGVAVGGEEQIVLLVDQHPGDAGQVGERAQERVLFAVEHVDPVGTGVRHIHEPAGSVDVGVVEARLRPGSDGSEADTNEAHALRPSATSCWHQA